MPHPADLKAYNEVLPGSAERLLHMAEESARVQNEALERESTAEVQQSSTGQSLAFLLTVIAFVAAIVFFALGNNFAGAAFVSVPVAMLIRSFIRGA